MPVACNATRRTMPTWPAASVRRERGSRGRRATAAVPAAPTAGRSPRPSSVACASCARCARADAGRSRVLLVQRPLEFRQLPAQALERKPGPGSSGAFSGACCARGCGPALERELNPERGPALEQNLELGRAVRRHHHFRRRRPRRCRTSMPEACPQPGPLPVPHRRWQGQASRLAPVLESRPPFPLRLPAPAVRGSGRSVAAAARWRDPSRPGNGNVGRGRTCAEV